MLNKILEETQRRLRQHSLLYDELRTQLENLPPPLSLVDALRGPGIAIIAEIKRASPSKGALNEILHPATLAQDYASAGAEAISILTEPAYFHGHLQDLHDVRQALMQVGMLRPLLCKDFILSPYQLFEARLWGADAVLLIAAALDDETLAVLFEQALELKLTPLVEVHTAAEVARVLPLHPPIIGINNRNLYEFTVDLAVTERLRPLIPGTSLVVSESGISRPEDVRRLAHVGVDAILVGEALVTAKDPASVLRRLKEAGR